MSEYENALAGAMGVLIAIMIEDGSRPEKIVKRLSSLKDGFAIMGYRNAAATIDLLITDATSPRPA